MKKYLFFLFLLNITIFNLSGQTDQLLKKCILSMDPKAKFIKDFRIQLGEQYSPGEFRYKETLSLRKKTRYRFTMCTADNSKGQLILNIRDNSDNPVVSSYDQETGTIYPYVDLTCDRSGIYQICFDFTGGQAGSGVSIVSTIQ
jgi:hypothetical protein